MQAHKIDICVVDDDSAQRTLLSARLQREQFNVVSADNSVEALRKINEHKPRIVICDLMMPGMNGLELCREIRATPALDGIYVIVVTAVESQEYKTQALMTGADDYLLKPYDLAELSARIRNGLRISRLQERLRSAAFTDGLTGLWNHTQFRKHLDAEFSRTRRYGGYLSLLMMDLDHFKAVNDTFGHEAGNRILRITARHLKNMVRDVDIVCRYGGEEFAVIMPTTNLEEAVALADRMRAAFSTDVCLAEHPQLTVTASIGVVANTDPRVNSAVDLINLADRALYMAKHRGRNNVVSVAELDDVRVHDELRLQDIDVLRKQVVSLSMQTKELCLQSVWALVQALDARDSYTAHHSMNVRFYCDRVAAAADWPEPLRTTVMNAAVLHDLGKIGIPDSILLKTDSLTQAEASVVRRVPLLTCKILDPLRGVFDTEIVLVRHLRERFDGSGYPDGLSGTNIPLGARLLAIGETFDAMTTDRTFRQRRSADEALAEIRAHAGTQFDPELVELFEKTFRAQEGDWLGQINRPREQLDLAAAH